MRKAKVVNCKYFAQVGNVFGGCKNIKATAACIYEFLNDCNLSERRYKLKGEKL